MDGAITEDGERTKEEKEGVDSMIIIIIYLLKSTEQEDAHMINTRTRAGQERHRKLALTFCPLKKQKKHTRYKNNYDYAYRKNAEKSTRLSDRLN